MNHFFGIVLSGDELPLTLRFARKRGCDLSAPSDFDVRLVGQRISHAWKLRRAKRWLHKQGILPWNFQLKRKAAAR